MTDQRAEQVRTDEWLLRHHITIVVQWAVQVLGLAILVATLAAFVLGFLAAIVGGTTAIVTAASIGSLLGFGFTLWFSNAPFPVELPDDDGA
jgi:hypothetical protein